MPALHLPSRVGRLFVVALLVVAAVAAGPAAASANATFAESVIVEENGDVASIPLVLSGADGATVIVERSDGTFEATLAVTDIDGDGRTTVQFNTYLAGRNPTRAFGTAGDDRVTVVNATRSDDTNATGHYKLSVVAESNPDGHDDVATLVVVERQAGSIDAWAAPRALAGNLTSPAAIERYERNESLETESVLRDDLLVLRLEASGLAGALAAREPGQNVTERFFEVLEREDANLTIEQTNPSPELPQKALLWNDTATTHVVADVQNDTYYLVIDTARVRIDPNVYHGSDPPESWLELHYREEFQAMFAYGDEPSVWDDDAEMIASGRFTVERRDADLDVVRSDGWLFFEPTANRSVTGRTNVRTGETLTVRLAGENGIDRTKIVVVEEDERGRTRFRATFDLGDVSGGTNVSVDVRYEKRSLLHEPIPGRIVQTSASARIVDVDTEGAYYSVEVNASTSHGGFVLLREKTADGPRIGKSSHILPGEREIVNVVLEERLSGTHTIVAVAYRDVDADGFYDADDEPYRTNGSVVTDQVDASFPTTTEQPPETSPVEPPSTTERPSTTTDGQPGFGFAVFTVVALLAAIAVARRRP